MPDAVIVSTARTPIGRAYRGAFNNPHGAVLGGHVIRHAWAGLRPLTPDEHAILDWAPEVRGLYLAIGFCGHGFQHSPATGQVVAELLTGAAPSIDIAELSLARFGGEIPTHRPRLGVG